MNVTRHGSRTVYQSRGFFIEQIEEDGISTTIGAPGVTGNPFRDPKQQMDLALYDHIEVVRGATGLTQTNSEPGGTINAVRKNRPTTPNCVPTPSLTASAKCARLATPPAH